MISLCVTPSTTFQSSCSACGLCPFCICSTSTVHLLSVRLAFLKIWISGDHVAMFPLGQLCWRNGRGGERANKPDAEKQKETKNSLAETQTSCLLWPSWGTALTFISCRDSTGLRFLLYNTHPTCIIPVHMLGLVLVYINIIWCLWKNNVLASRLLKIALVVTRSNKV